MYLNETALRFSARHQTTWVLLLVEQLLVILAPVFEELSIFIIEFDARRLWVWELIENQTVRSAARIANVNGAVKPVIGSSSWRFHTQERGSGYPACAKRNPRWSRHSYAGTNAGFWIDYGVTAPEHQLQSDNSTPLTRPYHNSIWRLPSPPPFSLSRQELGRISA